MGAWAGLGRKIRSEAAGKLERSSFTDDAEVRGHAISLEALGPPQGVGAYPPGDGGHWFTRGFKLGNWDKMCALNKVLGLKMQSLHWRGARA